MSSDSGGGRISQDDLLSLKKSLLGKSVDLKIFQNFSSDFYSGTIKHITDEGDGTVSIAVGSLVVRDKYFSNLWIPISGMKINFVISKEDKIWDLDSSSKIWIELKNTDTMTIYKKR